MAEGIARLLQKQGKLPADLFFASAGTAAGDGWPMSAETAAVLERLGATPDGHSKQLTQVMVERAALVLGMTRSHVAQAQALVDRSVSDKILPIDPAADIQDPIGLGQEVYDAVGQRLLALIPQRLHEVLKP